MAHEPDVTVGEVSSLKEALRVKAEALADVIEDIQELHLSTDAARRFAALARTNLEQAVMWAEKGLME